MLDSGGDKAQRCKVKHVSRQLQFASVESSVKFESKAHSNINISGDDMECFLTVQGCVVCSIQRVWLYVRLGVMYNPLLHKNGGWMMDFKWFEA